jgi:CheY-like chemotaxis protein
MISGLLVSQDKASLSNLTTILEKKGVMINWVDSGKSALNKISDSNNAFDFVLTDELLADMTGLQFLEKLIAVNPMINCAAVSPLAPEDFHESSEGLGIMLQLPPNPGNKEAEKLLECLTKILALTRKKE